MPHATLAEAVEALRRRLEDGANAALLAVGRAWAEEASALAPVDTGALKQSLVFELTGHLTGELRMIHYGAYVRAGVPTHTVMRVLKATPRRTQSSFAVAPHKGQAPNDFVQRAWESERVQGILTQFGAYTFTPGL